MALCVAIDDSGFVRHVIDSTIDNCAHFILISSEQYKLAVDPVLNPEDIASAFSWGFGAVVVIGYLSSYAVGVAKRLIKQV